MAKSSSIIKLQGTIVGLTFVKSSTYGDHVRAKRGTYKKADINEVLKQERKMLVGANVPAKIFKDAIHPYPGDFKSGMLWRLVSMFRKQLKDHGSFDFGRLERFEIYQDYPFEGFLRAASSMTFGKEKSVLKVYIKYDRHPTFSKVKSINGYQFTVIGIFPDLKKNTAMAVATTSKVIGLTGVVAPWRTQLTVPVKAKVFVVCIKIEGCVDGIVSNTRTTTGLCVIGSGRF